MCQYCAIDKGYRSKSGVFMPENGRYWRISGMVCVVIVSGVGGNAVNGEYDWVYGNFIVLGIGTHNRHYEAFKKAGSQIK